MKENFKLLALKQEIITLIISCSKSGGSLREVVAYKKLPPTFKGKALGTRLIFPVLLYQAQSTLHKINLKPQLYFYDPGLPRTLIRHENGALQTGGIWKHLIVYRKHLEKRSFTKAMMSQ